MKMFSRLVIFLFIILQNGYIVSSDINFKNKFYFGRSRKEFSFFSAQIKTYLHNGDMNSVHSIKCVLKKKNKYILENGTPVIMFNVADCSTIGFISRKKYGISRVYILGAGTEHRYTDTKSGNHIFFSRLSFFTNKVTDTFVY